MTNHVLRQALDYAERGWPVFPCQPGKKTPATLHGYLDATTDPDQVYAWFGRDPERNLAVATGAPGIDVLDIDQHGEAGDGFPALAQLESAGLLDGAVGNGPHPLRRAAPLLHRIAPAHRPPARQPHRLPVARAATSWPRPPRSAAPPTSTSPPSPGTASSTGRPPSASSQPAREPTPAQRTPQEHRQAQNAQIDRLARWVAAQPEGNRNNGLFWAANRALEDQPGRRPQPPRRSRPPGGTHRTRDHPHPRLRPAYQPGTPGPRDREAEGAS